MNAVARLKATASASGTVLGWSAIASVFCTAILHVPERVSTALVSVVVLSAIVMVASIAVAVVWAAVATFRFDVKLSHHIAEVRKGLENGSVCCGECGKSLSALLDESIDDAVKKGGCRGPVRMSFVRGVWFCEACADALGIPETWRESGVMDMGREVRNG
jgi:hypothetical protein